MQLQRPLILSGGAQTKRLTGSLDRHARSYPMSTGNADSPTTKEPTAILEYGGHFQASKLAKPLPNSRPRELHHRLQPSTPATAIIALALVTYGLFMAVSTTDPGGLCTDSTTRKPKSKCQVFIEGDYTGTQPRRDGRSPQLPRGTFHTQRRARAWRESS